MGNRMVDGQIVVPAAEGQHGWRYPADLRLFAAAAADDIAAFEPAALQAAMRTDRRASAVGGMCCFIQAYLGQVSRCTCVVYAALIIFFCFFYTSIVFNPKRRRRT